MTVNSSIAEAMLRVSENTRNVPETWSWGHLEDLCKGVYDCPHSTPKITATGPYVVRTQDILSGVFLAASAARVSEETYRERVARAVPRRGDLLYSREGTYFGIAAEVPAGMKVCLGQRMVLIRPDENALEFRFLRYWLNSPIMATYIHGFRDGSVAERLNLPTIRSLPVLVPSMGEQSAIAEVLGALDDKVAVNDRITVTAESMLKANFAYISHDADREVNLGSLMEFRYGKALREEDRNHGRIPVFGGNGDSGWHDVPLVDGPGIVVGRKGANAGSVSWSPGPFWPIDTSFYVKQVSSGIPLEFLYLLLETAGLRNLVGDSAIPGLNRDIALSCSVRLAGQDAIRIFAETARPLLTLGAQVADESHSLTELRDALLPKLMSGQIRVRDAEKAIEDVT